MIHNNDFIQHFMNKLDFPLSAVQEFTRVENRLDEEPAFGKAMDKQVILFMYPSAHDLGKRLKKVSQLAKQYREHEYTLHFVFLLNCTEILKKRYHRKGIDEEIYWDSMADLKYKLIECIHCKGVAGTFVAGWYSGFFKMTRFALGRFQYEHSRYQDKNPYRLACGRVIKKGDKTIGFHIPSSGLSLTREVRLASYKKAYRFYQKEFHGKPIFFSCGSWLLYPRHKEFLPENSHILEFMDDFEIPFSAQTDTFRDAWRIYGKDADLPPEQLPRETSLQRAYADWLNAGNKAGDGWGVFCFDGEKILK